MRIPVDTVMVQQRAASFTRRSIKTKSKLQGLLRLALSMIDLTTLRGKRFSRKSAFSCVAKRFHLAEVQHDPPLPSVAAVCVYPSLVRVAKNALAGSLVCA